jgi:hypothetical protein
MPAASKYHNTDGRENTPDKKVVFNRLIH